MDEEILDLVNENDEVIGEISRTLAHKDSKYIHREIVIVLYNNDGKVLLQKRSFKKKTNPGKWSLTVGGHIPKGFVPENAAHKELLEELGFDTNLKFFKKDKVVNNFETRFLYFYIGKYNNEKIILQAEEVADAKLFSREEMLKIQDSIGSITKSVCYDFWDGKIKYEN